METVPWTPALVHEGEHLRSANIWKYTPQHIYAALSKKQKKEAFSISKPHSINIAHAYTSMDLSHKLAYNFPITTMNGTSLQAMGSFKMNRRGQLP